VVAAAQGQQPLPARTSPRTRRLQRHLDRHLDGDRSRVREEHVNEPAWRHPRQPLGETDGGLVRQPAEHHVSHPSELVCDRRVQDGVAVTVDRTPPGGHAIHQLAPVGQTQPHALGGHDRKRVAFRRNRTVRVPHVAPVGFGELIPCPRRRQARPTAERACPGRAA